MACCACARRGRRNEDDSPPAGRVITSWAQLRSGSANPDEAEETARLTSNSEFPLSQLPERRSDEDAERGIPNPVGHHPVSGPPSAYDSEGSQVEVHRV
ncbi:hypothetical protein GSI_01608 [Ganoderma sinense ZZ0214-1]|uniref:Uncharacterized protein n=1 Tax=Ganoderma sinense ZZ0214-1 TaxID=1077348 RepID=A0A2G8SQU7_9APHY|nr:hypothetical protein GSI_01608 [Ganoderma sinense ZZ0214-1]